MPELPEVETIRCGLERLLVGATVAGIDRSSARLRRPSPVPLEALVGRGFVRARRHGKFLLLDLDDGGALTVHLGMSGKLLFSEAGVPRRPHTHAVLHLEDGRELRYVDPRRFGMLRLYAPGAVVEDTRGYGVDALDPALDAGSMERLLRSSRAPLKAFLLDQSKVAGLGNIYACEALWRCGLSPRRRACNAPRGRVPLLMDSVRDVLGEALAAGGSTFNDYVDAVGEAGSFMMQVAVFRREGLPCPRCAAPVVRIVQSGRSTFLCRRCQR